MLKPLVLCAALIGATTAAGAESRPSLREVPEIENTLFAVAIADAVRDHCEAIHARKLKALVLLRRIKAHANSLGYSDDEIRAYVESDTEKARMRAKGEAFLRQQGVDLKKPASFCAFGRAEIGKNSAIGALLKAK